MKTRLIFLVLLIVCYSCGTINKPVTDAQKEKIKGEVKEVVNTIIKGFEEADFDKALEPFLDSPDFRVLAFGRTYSYKELMDMKPSFNVVLNQKCTIVNETYQILDKSNVVYTTNCKWAVNYKDGHSTIEDPEAFMFMLKKIDGRWRVSYYADTYIEKIVKYKEPSKELNQVELMKQFLGSWKYDIAKDTTFFWDTKSYGTGVECNFKIATKGKIISEGKHLIGYDKQVDKFILSILTKGLGTEILSFWFTSKSKFHVIPYSYISNPEKASWKIEGDFISPDIFTETTILDNKSVKTDTYTRIK
jgi:hypothetical protein